MEGFSGLTTENKYFKCVQEEETKKKKVVIQNV